jgi:hypothetical protein
MELTKATETENNEVPCPGPDHLVEMQQRRQTEEDEEDNGGSG